MIVCDLCGQPKECLQKQIEGKEYDICSECWKPLAEKLKSKGRAKKERETVLTRLRSIRRRLTGIFATHTLIQSKREIPVPAPESQ